MEQSPPPRHTLMSCDIAWQCVHRNEIRPPSARKASSMWKVHEDATQVPRQERENSGLDLCRVTCHIFSLIAVVPPPGSLCPLARSGGTSRPHVFLVIRTRGGSTQACHVLRVIWGRDEWIFQSCCVK